MFLAHLVQDNILCNLRPDRVQVHEKAIEEYTRLHPECAGMLYLNDVVADIFGRPLTNANGYKALRVSEDHQCDLTEYWGIVRRLEGEQNATELY